MVLKMALAQNGTNQRSLGQIVSAWEEKCLRQKLGDGSLTTFDWKPKLFSLLIVPWFIASGCSMAVEHMPYIPEVMGCNPSGHETFF